MFTACASPRRLLLCVDITQLHCREVEVRGNPGMHQGTPDIELGLLQSILKIPALSLFGDPLILPGRME